MTEPVTSKISIRGCNIALMRGGAGRPLLFLHAGGGAGWLPFMADLAARHDVIVPEHPGFGASDTPDWLDNIQDLARFYLDFLDQIDLNNVDLVGSSLGGWVAAEIAVRNTKRLNSLTLIGSAGIHVPGVPQVDTFLLNDEQLIRSLFDDGKRIEAMIAEAKRPELEDAILKNRTTTAKLVWQPRSYDPHLHKWLRRIDVPAHLIWGANDKLFPKDYAFAFQKLIPGSSVTIIPGSGHLPHIEQREAFVTALEGFLEKEEGRRMKVFNFHLMPYRHADLDAIEKNGSAWVTYPNSDYDAKKGAELYHEYLDQMELADELGFDGVCLNEHHQTAYGMMPTPGPLAGALTRSVKKAKIAILGRALPLVNNPLVIAEEYAMLDNLSRGRLIAGFVRGIGAEYHAMGINPGFSQERFSEAHDLIIRAWTETGPFPYVGKHYHFNYVNPWPRPYQTPHPPVWIPSQGSSSTIKWAAKMRYTYAQTLSPIAVVARMFQMYRDEAEKAGYQASPDQLAWSNTIYVAETDEKAMREARPHLEALANKFLKMPTEMLLPPGYTNIESIKRIRAAKITGKPQTIEDLVRAGVVIVGSPNTVREKLAEYQDLAGFNTSLTKTQFGTLPDDMTRANMHAIAEEILPHFRDRLPQGKRQAAAE